MLTVEFLKAERNKYLGPFSRFFICCIDKHEIIEVIDQIKTSYVSLNDELELAIIIAERAQQTANYKYAKGSFPLYKLFGSIAQAIGFDVIDTLASYENPKAITINNYQQIRQYCYDQRHCYKQELKKLSQQCTKLNQLLNNKKSTLDKNLNNTINKQLKNFETIDNKLSANDDYYRQPACHIFLNKLIQYAQNFNELLANHAESLQIQVIEPSATVSNKKLEALNVFQKVNLETLNQKKPEFINSTQNEITNNSEIVGLIALK